MSSTPFELIVIGGCASIVATPWVIARDPEGALAVTGAASMIVATFTIRYSERGVALALALLLPLLGLGCFALHVLLGVPSAVVLVVTMLLFSVVLWACRDICRFEQRDQ